MHGKRTSIQVYESTREELVKIKGQLEARNGKPRRRHTRAHKVLERRA